MWDGLYVSLKELKDEYKEYKSKIIFQNNADAIKNGFKELFKNGIFDEENAKKTTKQSIINRVKIIKDLILKLAPINNNNEPRLFNRDPKTMRQLWSRQEGICPLCLNEIHEDRMLDVTYTNLDHIKPFSLGGTTSISNCQLVHDSCNKSKKDSYNNNN